jgi:hypothetical protein
MRPTALIGLTLIVLGILALSVHSVTYFSSDHEVGPLGFFVWNVSKPHTIVINPLAGIAAMVVGVVLFLSGRRQATV